jgi:hypothetical protein
MRICLVGPTHPYRGGISHFTAMLAREMSGAHDVHIVSFSRLYPGFLFPGRTQFDESASPLTVESERVIDSINPLAWRRAADAVLAHDPGVVVFQWWHPFFAPAFRAIRGAELASRANVVLVEFNIDADVIESALRSAATAALEEQKAEWKRNNNTSGKQITNDDVKAYIVKRSPDEWATLQSKKAKAEEHCKLMKSLADRLAEREKDLRQMVARSRAVE